MEQEGCKPLLNFIEINKTEQYRSSGNKKGTKEGKQDYTKASGH
jgi:hypothetical protein